MSDHSENSILIDFIEKLKKWKDHSKIIAYFVVGAIYLHNWYSDIIADKVAKIVMVEMVDRGSYDIGTTEMLLRLTKAEIRSIQRDGVSSLDDQGEHLYETLKKTEEKLSCNRDKLLGITDDC